jgi:hypothetical protein
MTQKFSVDFRQVLLEQMGHHQPFPHFHESPHNEKAHPYRLRTVENSGRHHGPVFGKNAGTAAYMPLG